MDRVFGNIYWSDKQRGLFRDLKYHLECLPENSKTESWLDLFTKSLSVKSQASMLMHTKRNICAIIKRGTSPL